MKFTAILIIASLFIFPLVSVAQTGDSKEALLHWDALKKLTWNDYLADPNPNSDAAASTTTYLTISYNISSRSFSYKIDSRFSKTRSWGLHKTAYILSHEQGHFDIAEIFARKLNRKLSEYQFDRKDYEKDLKKIYLDILEEKKEMQEDYDRETNHSINREKQAEWLKKIALMLEESVDYANY